MDINLINWDLVNSGLNALANLLLFLGCLYFYYHHITKELHWLVYHVLRVAAAMMLSGTLMRALLDIDYVIAGKSKMFIWYEAVMALLRNYGTGIILPYSVYKYVILAFEVTNLRKEVETLKNIKK
jgi:hypothetical protein